MKVIKLEDGTEVKISDESYQNMLDAVRRETYDDIAVKLFKDTGVYWLTTGGTIHGPCTLGAGSIAIKHLNNCTTSAQAQKLLAYNQLMNVAKYLNNGWKQTADDRRGFIFMIDPAELGPYYIEIRSTEVLAQDVVFKTKELAKKALEILGEDVILKALNPNY
jgi:hypothetical protein